MAGVLNVKLPNLIAELQFYKLNIVLIDKLNKKIGYKKNLYTIILVLLDEYKDQENYQILYDNYRKRFDFYSEKQEEQQNQQEKTTSQQDSWVEWKKVEKLTSYWRRRSQKDKNNEYLFFITLLSYLYVKLPPNRNIFNSFLYGLPSEEKNANKTNYFYKNAFHFNQTKTKKRYVIQLLKKDLALIRLINEYRIKFNKGPLLLRDPFTHKKITKAKYIQYMKEMTKPSGQEISSRMLRTLYTSQVAAKQPIQKRLEIAKMMDHSISTSVGYYEKQ